ncbi:trehalose synthase (Ccg-9), partial [Setomelanomma holmii]
IAPKEDDPRKFLVGITLHDGTYSMDYAVHQVYRPDTSGYEQHHGEGIEDFIASKVLKFKTEKYYKVAGCGITKLTAEICPKLATKLWLSQDIVTLVLDPFGKDADHDEQDYHGPTMGTEWQVDEESDSVVRKALEQFGQEHQLRVQVWRHNRVGVDANDKAQLLTRDDFKDTVHFNTWDTTMAYADRLCGTKIAFFNSTPQGGGVALMRHALVRFCRIAKVQCDWYVPRPKPEVFRITKTNHNILQGVDMQSQLTPEHIQALDEWCEQNAERYWLSNGGPLMARSEGGAHVIIIDDPQMPKLVEIAKQNDPDRPVIFRSHIQVRADLVDQPDAHAATVWNWIWQHIHKCDVFVSHPVPEFVPRIVPSEKVGYMPATTDWLDGLNKNLHPLDEEYYLLKFQREAIAKGYKFRFDFAGRDYIVQIARFDPAKGILHVLGAFAKLRRDHMKDWKLGKTPQLVIAGHGAVDDPDAVPIYNEVMETIKRDYQDLEEDIIVMRVGPVDQILNSLMAHSKIALQLSNREGFEVKVSEALHHGKPVIATRRGGIPLQIEHGQTGFLVESDNDTPANVAKYLCDLFADGALYDRMSAAATGVSDEVSTVGNAMSWLYLANMLAQDRTITPNRRWISDMAREELHCPYDESEESKEVLLKRSLSETNRKSSITTENRGSMDNSSNTDTAVEAATDAESPNSKPVCKACLEWAAELATREKNATSAT